MRQVMPHSAVFTASRTGMISVLSTSKHWPCLFPQHGAGKKHTRKIELAEWQQEIVARYPAGGRSDTEGRSRHGGREALGVPPGGGRPDGGCSGASGCTQTSTIMLSWPGLGRDQRRAPD